MAFVVDIQRGASVAGGAGVRVLDVGLSATVAGKSPRRYLGRVVPRSGSSPEARRPRLLFRILVAVPVVMADGTAALLLPTAIVEVP